MLQEATSFETYQRNEILDQLVFGYESHSCVLTQRELAEMGLPVGLVDGEQRRAAFHLIDLERKGEEIIRFVEPAT